MITKFLGRVFSGRMFKPRQPRIIPFEAHGIDRGRISTCAVRTCETLQASGEHVGRKRVIRLMRAEQLRGRPRRRFRLTTQADAVAPAAPNLVNQNFTVSKPNALWTADITAIATGEGWLYLAVLLDLYSRRVVGWAVRPTLTPSSCAPRGTWPSGVDVLSVGSSIIPTAAASTRVTGIKPCCARRA